MSEQTPVPNPFAGLGGQVRRGLRGGLERVTGTALAPYQSAVIRIGFSLTWLLFLLREWPHRQELYGPNGVWDWDMRDERAHERIAQRIEEEERHGGQRRRDEGKAKGRCGNRADGHLAFCQCTNLVLRSRGAASRRIVQGARAPIPSEDALFPG
jgi:hypothetical protein